MGHQLDANTVALWRLDETVIDRDYTTAADETGENTLTETTGGSTPFAFGIAGGPPSTDRATKFARSCEGTRVLSFSGTETTRQTLLGSHTLEAWVYLDQLGVEQALFAWFGSGENVATNYLNRFYITTSNRLGSFWEWQQGSNLGAVQNVGATVPLRTWTHVAATFDAQVRVSEWSLLFGGTNEYVLVSAEERFNFEKDEAFSISCWVKHTATGDVAVSKQGGATTFRGYLLNWATANPQIILRHDAGTGDEIRVSANVATNDNAWHHVVMTYDGSETAAGVAFYVDGAVAALTVTTDALTGTIQTTDPLAIGIRPADSGGPWVGNIDCVTIYDKVLTSGEVTTLFGRGGTADHLTVGPTTNLIGFWEMGDDATFPNIPDERQVSTKSLVFDGTNEHVLIGDVAALDFERTAPFSISCWFKTSSATNQTLFIKRGAGPAFTGYALIMLSTGNLRWELVGNAGSSALIRADSTTVFFADDEWHHVVVTTDGSSTVGGLTIYVDDVAVPLTTSGTLAVTILNSDPAAIGYAVQESANPMLGSIDEVAVYDKELSAGEVTTVYNKGATIDHAVTGPTGDLVGYWEMGDGATFPTIPDASTNSNDGAMTNMVSGDIQNDVPGLGVMTNMESGDIRRDAPVPLVDVGWYINGVLEDTDTDVRFNEGGTTRSPTVFVEGVTGSLVLRGRCFEMRLSNKARTTPEILASATDVDFEHDNDANTVSLWRFNEPPEAIDISDNGWHFGPENNNQAAAGAIPEPARRLTLGDNGYSRYWKGGSLADTRLEGPRAQELVGYFTGALEYTIEMWVQVGPSQVLDATLMAIANSGETEAANYQFSIRILSGGELRAFWENGAGVNVEDDTASPFLDPTNVDDMTLPVHVAWVKESVGGGLSDVHIYKNGILFETFSNRADPTGGTTGVLTLGTDHQTPSLAWEGFIDDVRISDIARTPAEILASFQEGNIGGVGSGVTTYYKKRARDSACGSPAQYVSWVDTDPAAPYPGALPCGGPLVEEVIVGIVQV